MGNCYGQSPEYTNEEIQKHLRTSKIKHKPIIPDSDLSDIDTTTEKEERISPLLSVISDSYIESLIEQLNEIMNNFEMSRKTKILKKKLKTFESPFELYFMQENYQPDPTIKKRKLHNMFARTNTLFSPSMSLLYELNTGEALMKKIDGNLKDYKVIRSDKSKDSNTIIQILHMTTKKFLIVKSKFFLTMRIFRRVSNDEYVIVGESVLRNDLSLESDLKKLRNEASNECEIFMTGSKYGNIGDDFTCCNLTRGDFKTSTGSAILKPIFKKTFNKYYNSNLKELVEFTLQDHDLESLIWFDDDKKVIEKIIMKQRKVLLDFMNEVPDLFTNEWTQKLEEMKSNIEEYNKNADKEEPSKKNEIDQELIDFPLLDSGDSDDN
jgi:hypothetical protein